MSAIEPVIHTLADVNNHMRTALRRFYPATEHIDAWGVGLDRVTQPHWWRGSVPSKLAARGRLNIDLLGGGDSRH